jgi:hypothetical protein
VRGKKGEKREKKIKKTEKKKVRDKGGIKVEDGSSGGYCPCL